MTGFYLVGEKWVSVFTGPAATNDTPINIGVSNISGATPFGGDWATVRFHDFHLVADSITCQ